MDNIGNCDSPIIISDDNTSCSESIKSDRSIPSLEGDDNDEDHNSDSRFSEEWNDNILLSPQSEGTETEFSNFPSPLYDIEIPHCGVSYTPLSFNSDDEYIAGPISEDECLPGRFQF